MLERKDKSKVGRLTSSVAWTKYGEVAGPETTVGGRGKGSGWIRLGGHRSKEEEGTGESE